MSEKKAQELFKQQMQAELTNDELARELEKQLNEGGWYITSSPEGPTIKRKDTSVEEFVPDWLMPKESTVAPAASPTNENPNRGIWIAVGISLAVIIVIVTTIVIIKKYKKNVPQLTGV